ncbi:mineralocorticoid receptor isoform X1 [Nothobranchius furzeri]|uniref:Nuclear receptor subfamily 3, group C, member 2 n=1 Tax=Nothobranchius furzeri TaxID=105023 RepID=A0A1A7ZBV5_NOTFU|nr:mineralocorticoid receptor [Nothobranchius furzeri]KAF7223642.1 transcript variant X2 [Nothobranchius furzeri]KAF7223643.1 transcript variant X1 [Nothobranchius furzeri]
METKGYQSFFDGGDSENKWSQSPSTMEYCRSTEDSSLTSSDILMDMVNVSCPAGSPTADIKDNKTKKQEQPMPQLSQNQPFVLPHFNNSLLGHKREMDSKELSKTVAESMGLYMNAAREADFAFSQHGGSTGKLYPACGRPLEENQCGSKKSSKSQAFGFQQTSTNPRECTTGTPVSSASMLASSLSCSPKTSSCISSPGGSNNMVSSTTSPPTCFGPLCSSASSPGSQTSCAATLANIKRRNSATCSPVESSTVGSPPLTSPLNVMRSPMSSPQSMSSVRSPSCSTTCNIRSSVSSPTGVSCTGTANNSRPSISSPATGGPMSISSPENPSSTGFPVSSPAGGLGLVQNDTNSPEAAGIAKDTDFKSFEFPKVEMVDGEVFSVGLDQMGMVKYIKNEPGTDFRSMCLGSSNCNTSCTPFVTQIKTEPNKNEECMNQQPYGEQSPSLGLFPASETTYLSLRNNIDEYSLSGILGPPVSSVNGNYEADMFSSIMSKGVKQESTDGSYYQENNSMSASAIVGVNSGGHSFHYQIGAQGTMSFTRHNVRDQSNPLLNLISPVTALMESWKSRPGMSQGSLSSRGEGYSGQNCITDSISSSPLRQPSSTVKVCLVCGDEASGCHYGVVTCGSCKVFFKRAVEGQHNYLCAGRNDCIIDKIRRKNCPACRVRKCLQAGMNLGARKSKKLKLKGVSEDLQSSKEGQIAAGGVGSSYLSSEKELNPSPTNALVPHGPGVVTPFLPPSISSVLELIEPEDVYSGYDNTQADTTDHLLSSLNRLAGKQMVCMVKWAKVLPGFRGLPIEDQITLIQYSWMCLSTFCLSWRSYKHTNGQMLYFAPDLIFNEDRMRQSAMYDLCLGMRQVSQEFVRLQLTYDEFLSMKVLLLLSTVPKEGLKNQAAFEEMRVNYIKELRRSVGKATNNSGQTWQRFFQLTKLLDAMHDLVGNLLDFCFYTFRESQALKVEFPEMLVEIISDQIPKVESGLTHTIFFHKK